MTSDRSHPAALPIEHAAFYRFVVIADPPAVARWMRRRAGTLKGSIIVASEGINGVLAGTVEALDEFEVALGGDRRFDGMTLQRSGCRTVPFARLAVHCRAELVAVGLPASVTGLPERGRALAPAVWRQFIDEPDVVLLDNRNSFEFRLGHFRSARDPGVRHFRDFPRYVADHAVRWKAEGQRVGMYCTGGIRCEKTSGWMRQAFGLDVFELEGGVLNYFRQIPDADREWQGECFVFDNRIALDTCLQETSTTAEDVYDGEPDGAWRLARARRLDAAS